MIESRAIELYEWKGTLVSVLLSKDASCRIGRPQGSIEKRVIGWVLDIDVVEGVPKANGKA